jgi:hypothetical protein
VQSDQRPAYIAPSIFHGEYLVGDGTWIITPVAGVYEMRNDPQSQPYILYFEGVENHTLWRYATKDRAIVFKMNAQHDTGMYYEDDEQWPVTRFSEAKKEIVQNTDTALQQHENVHTELKSYNGEYKLVMEGADELGVTGQLQVFYLGDSAFSFNLSVEMLEQCWAIIEGEAMMDKPNHAVYSPGNCVLHFYFATESDEGTVIDIKQQGPCAQIEGDCSLSARYVLSPLRKEVR